jgi:hypothetical protein
MRNGQGIFVGKPEGKKSLGKCRVVRKIRWVGLDWINFDQDRNKRLTLVSSVKSLRMPFIE